MRGRRWVIACVLLAFGRFAAAEEIVIRGGWLFDGVRDFMIRNSGIIVANGKFIAVGADLSHLDLSKVRLLTLTDNDYILPGLFDLHAHYNMTLNKIRRDEVEVMPVLYLANGVTSTFPAGEFDPEAMMEARKRIDRGEKIGPRIYNSGPYFGPARPGWDPDISAEEIGQELDALAERGIAGVKVKRISATHLETVIERAHAHGLTVTGHLDSGYRDTINPRDAILMGIDRVEHFLGGDAIDPKKPAYDSLVDVAPDSAEFRRIVALFIKHGVYFDATLTAYGYFGERGVEYEQWVDERKFLTPYASELTEGRRARIDQFGAIYEVKRRTLKAFYDAGGADLITLGTDHASTGEYLAGFAAHREIHAMVLCGIPPAAVLKIATINGAKAIGRGDKLGSIAPGKWADLIVVRGNPLNEIRNTRQVRTVMKGGRIYDPAVLLESVVGKLGPQGPEEAVDW